ASRGAAPPPPPPPHVFLSPHPGSLRLLQTLPDAPERAQHQLHVYVALGGPLMTTRGQAAPEGEQVYSQAYALCQQVEDTAQLLPVLAGLRLFYVIQAAHQTAQGLSQRLLKLAQRHREQAFWLEAQIGLGGTLFFQASLMRRSCICGRA